jgi:hypothetical protein
MPNPNIKEKKWLRMLVSPFRGIVKWASPTAYVKYQYRYITHHQCHLEHPTRYTEKLQYLRLFVYPKMPLVSQCAGRVGVRDYLHSLDLDKYLIPIYGVFDRFEDIEFDALPAQFVMKCSHGCALNDICTDKDELDKVTLAKKFRKWLKLDYGKKTMERHYSPIKPQIIIEKYLGDGKILPTEYKIHVFNGKAHNLYVVTGRKIDIRYTNLYIDWKPFDGSQFNGWKKADEPVTKPKNFPEMVRLAEKLAKPFPFVRVDLYNINGKIYFGEMTFTPAKGTLILDDDRCDFEMGDWLDISSLTNKRK